MMSDRTDPALQVPAALRRIAAFGLPWDVRGGLDLPDEHWPAFLAAVGVQKLEGLLSAAIDAGVLSPPAHLVAATLSQERAAQHVALLLEARALQAHDRLRDGGVESRLIKGPVIARGLYAQPSWRLFRDVDVLVPASDFDRAVAVLISHGMQRPHPQLREGWDRRFAKTVMLADTDGVQIDLHRTLVKGPFGLWIDPSDLLEPVRHVRIAGRAVPTVGRETEILALCYHAALGDVPPRLGPLRDVAQALSQCDLDLDSVAAMAQRWRGEVVLTRALTLVEHYLGGLPEAGYVLRRRVRQPKRYRVLLESNVRLHDNGAAVAGLGLLALPDAASRRDYLASILLPDRSYLSSRGLTGTVWLRRSRRKPGRHIDEER